MHKLKLSTGYFFILFCLLLFTQEAYTQKIDSLHTVEVSAPYSRIFSTANRVQIIDNNILNRYKGNNIGELLSIESDVFIKSYGIGTLASSSIRGGGSNHTAILWNGFNLENPMHGPEDLSLLSAGLFNRVIIQYGSSGATWGSGAVGGAIHLTNAPVYDSGINVFAGASLGSFKTMQQQAGFTISKKKLVSSLKISNQTAKNNFPFINNTLSSAPTERLSNAEMKQTGILNENYFQINNHQKINVRLWYQSASRNIPPTLTQENNASNQQDAAYRLTSEWQHISEKWLLTARAGYFYETLFYTDPAIALRSKSKTHVTIGEAEAKYNFSPLQLFTIAVNNRYSNANANGYANNPYQNRLAFIGSYRLQNKPNTLKGFITVRQELIMPGNHEKDTIAYVPFLSKGVTTAASRPLTWSLGGEDTFYKSIIVNASIAQHYRIPTFNDLYWAQGGNPLLKPESGWGEEAGITFHKMIYKVATTIQATVFNRNIDNWILWTPTDMGYWMPKNIMQVWSRGAEYRIHTIVPVQKVELSFVASWNYTLSTNEKSYTPNDPSISLQLPYTPLYKGNASITASFKSFSITYNQKYVGYTYTTSDHSFYLNPYWISNCYLSYTANLLKLKFQFFAEVNNLFNKPYQVIENRPMPGINFQAGFTASFNKSNNP